MGIKIFKRKKREFRNLSNYEEEKATRKVIEERDKFKVYKAINNRYNRIWF